MVTGHKCIPGDPNIETQETVVVLQVGWSVENFVRIKKNKNKTVRIKKKVDGSTKLF